MLTKQVLLPTEPSSSLASNVSEVEQKLSSKICMPGMVAHSCHPSIGRQKENEFEASLVHRESPS